ncbi:hypothetical protein [Solemya elarraichensis gill symbiont]|nr:hypothetical protein [Solemya elarraichensis gill symbiont]
MFQPVDERCDFCLAGLTRLDKSNVPAVGVVAMILLLLFLQPVSQLSED